MNEAAAHTVEGERVDPGMIVAVNNLVTDARRALDSGAGKSWGADQRRALEDTLDRVRALMRELASLAGPEDGEDDPRPGELALRRAELLAGTPMLDGRSGQPNVQPHPR